MSLRRRLNHSDGDGDTDQDAGSSKASTPKKSPGRRSRNLSKSPRRGQNQNNGHNQVKKEAYEAAKLAVDKDEEGNRYGIIASIYYLIVIVVIGLPLWYVTTSPSRYSLPDVSHLTERWRNTIHLVPITIVTLNEFQRDGNDPDLDQFRASLRSQLKANFEAPDGSFQARIEWTVRKSHPEEEDIFKITSSLEEIDEHLREKISSISKRGSLKIYLLPAHLTPLLLTTDTNALGYVMGFHRAAFLKRHFVSDSQANSGIVFNRIDDIVDLALGRGPTFTSPALKLAMNSPIDVLLNIVSEREDLATIEPLVEKKIDLVHDLALNAFFRESGIADVITVKTVTQRTHHALDEKFMKTHAVADSGAKQGRLFMIDYLPSLLNNLESRIIEHNSKHVYHIHVLIPDEKLGPIHFYNSKSGHRSAAVVTEYRGGLMIWNEDSDFPAAYKSFMRTMLGLSENPHKSILRRDIFFTDWELDSVMRSIVNAHLNTSLSSLVSIQSLIGKIGNIVIQRDISHKMHSSVDSAHESLNHLAAGQLGHAYLASTRGYRDSETAFFHPSLLALLYFPDDQKYAVYFPLFLPISLPLVTSLFLLIKKYRASKSLQKDDSGASPQTEVAASSSQKRRSQR